MGTIYDNGKAHATSWIVYINGLEVPTVAVQTSHGTWQIPEATIQMVPDPALLRLGAEDRVQVQTFYCDQWYRDPPEFCLLFDGEIVAWSFSSTTGGRAISFSCVDYTQILTQLFFFFMSSFDDIAVGVSGAAIGVQGSTVQLAGFGALYPYSLFTQGLADTTTDPDNPNVDVINRPVDFAYNIVRALIKLDHPNRTVPSANFFAPWAKRTNYHKRWVALPYVDADPGGDPGLGVFPILRAKQAEEALAAVARKASQVGTQGSMWDMLGEVLRSLMMEIAMIPTPAAVRSDFKSLLPKGTVNGNVGPVFLTNYFVKPQFLFGLPPACNVFFPSQISDYGYNENYVTQPTRMYFNEETILAYLNRNATPNGVNSTGASLMQDALCTGYPEEVDNAIKASINERGQNGKNLLVYPEEFFKGPVIARRAMPSWFVFLQQALAGKSVGGPVEIDDPQAPDGDDNNIADPGEAGRRTAQNDEDLSGAQEAVYYTKGQQDPAEIFGAIINTLPSRGAYASRDLRARMASTRYQSREPSRAVAPDRHPFLNPAQNTRFSDTFFSSRRTDTRLRIHAGHDFPANDYTATIVCVAAGEIFRYRTYDNPTNNGPHNWQGNAVHIRDKYGAVHKYMHLDSINPKILEQPLKNARTQYLETPMTIPAGYVLGTAGNSGRGRPRGGANGIHLHYDVTTRNGYRLNYSTRFRRLKDHKGVSESTHTSPTAQPGGNGGGAIEASGKDVHGLFQLYAACEYYKERYARRQGAISLPFNPYPVAGFPCATFDRRSSAVDTVGYIMSIRQVLSLHRCTTDVAFSHGRTFQEMFSLMQHQAAYENARIGLDQGAISQAVESRQITTPGESEIQDANTALSKFTLPGGPLATAPAEPIPEIRALMQDFTRADEFYKALFYHGAAPGADALTGEQALRTSTSAPNEAVPFVTNDAVADTVARADLTDATRSTLEVRASVAGAVNTDGGRFAPVTAAERPAGGGVFRYPDVIDLITPAGHRVGIEIEGYDAVTRDRLLGLIAQIRTGNVSDEQDLALFEQSFGVTVELPRPGQPISETLHQFLNAKEYELRTTAGSTNVHGDVTIVPRPAAEGLFQDFATAMAYNGRPICTLEEYISFLGPDGLREGRVVPRVAAASRSTQLHPAPFYTRIRRFKPGPPMTVPGTNLTNTAEGAPSADGAPPTYDVQGLPEDFPDTRADWDTVLEQYRYNVLSKLSPND